MKWIPIARNAPSALSRLAITAALLLLALGVLLGLYEALRATGALLFDEAHGAAVWLMALAQAALTVVIIYWTFVLARREQPITPWIFLLICVGGGFLIHVLLAAIVKPVWGTDYRLYWEYAQKLVERGEYGALTNLYYGRSLFIPYPIVRLFGPEATYVLKLANIAMLGGIQLFVYDILRRISGHRAAQAGSLLLLAAPMPAYTTMIPSHDLWGTFFVAAYSWLITLAFDERPKSPTAMVWRIMLVILAGAIAYMAEVQRNIGLILCLALLIAAVLHRLIATRNQPSRTQSQVNQIHVNTIVLLSLISASAYVVSDRVGEKLGLEPTGREAYLRMKFAANSSGLTDGASPWFARFHDRFGEKQASAEEAADFAISIGLSSWTVQPIDRIRHMAWQGSWLFSLSYPDEGWNWILRKPSGISKQTRSFLVLYADLFAIGFASVLILALFRLATSRNPPPIPILTLLIAVLGLALSQLLLFSNKPTNLLPIWVAGPLAIGYALARREDARDATAELPSRWRLAIGGGALIAITIVIILGLLRIAYRQPQGQMLSDWTYELNQKQAPSQQGWQEALLDARPEAFDKWAYDPKRLGQNYINRAGKDGDRIREYAGDTVTRMEFPSTVLNGDQLRLQTQACRGKGRRGTLEFFLFAPRRPWIKEVSSRLTVSIDGIEARTIKVPLKGRNFQRFTVRNAVLEGCHQLAFTVQVNKTRDGKAGPSPMVEIWLPRLIE